MRHLAVVVAVGIFRGVRVGADIVRQAWQAAGVGGELAEGNLAHLRVRESLILS
jgi:hypothetical protein